MLITRNLTSSCCFSEFSPQPELETWCRGLSGRSVTPESLSVAAHRQHLGGSERGDLVLDGLGSNPSSTTYNLWALEQVVQPYCASPLLPVKWVDVKVKHVNIRKGLKDLDPSMLWKEVFAVTIITSHVLMAAWVPSSPLCRISGLLISFLAPLPCSKLS